jgi:hypothetical protein
MLPAPEAMRLSRNEGESVWDILLLKLAIRGSVKYPFFHSETEEKWRSMLPKDKSLSSSPDSKKF